jgi:hypothetical protein
MQYLLKHLKYLKYTFATYGRGGDTGLGARAPPARATLMGALGSTRHRPEARDSTTSTCRDGRHARQRGSEPRAVGGTTRARSESRRWVRTTSRSEKRITRGGACAGRWLRRQMRSGADGQPHSAVKRAMGEQIGRYFLKERCERCKDKVAGLVGRGSPGRRRLIGRPPAPKLVANFLYGDLSLVLDT